MKMDRGIGLLVAVCFILVFSSLGSAVVGEGCARDANCDTGEICDENDQDTFSGVTLGTCQAPSGSYICGRDSTCTTQDDCLGYGRSACGLGGICVAGGGALGYRCQQDQDCYFDGSLHLCLGDICTSGNTESYIKCNFHTDCGSGQWCNDVGGLFGYCQEKKVNGMSASAVVECQSNYIWNGVCS